ncbi:MAG: FemAB family protein [Syntrophus sp. PtaB.Bin138]|nr:MAG: FemAB family protein [Syntrophus sp. PtaB.Bin138]
MNLEPLNPSGFDNWDEAIRSLPGASFFHTAAWAAALGKSYGYEPVYFTLREGDLIRAVLPCMDVQSPLTGKRGVCLPFTDYCEPLAPDAVCFRELFDTAIDFGRKRLWRYIEIRGGEAFLSNEESSEQHHGHILDLSAGTDKIFAGLRDSTRRNIKKAQKEKIETDISTSPAALAEFRRLNSMTRRDHGLPPQPKSFFDHLHDQILSKSRGFVALASFRGEAVAANVYFHRGEEMIYKYGASNRAFQNLRSNNLVMWEAIRWGCANGCRTLCFGRTEPDNDGLLQFKSGWGARERLIKYYRYDLRKGAFLKTAPGVHPSYKKIFNRLPIPVLETLGRLLYRHMG